MSGPANGSVSAAEVHSTLQMLAARMAADGHPLQAIKCYLAMLNQSLLPTDEAATRLRLAQLLMQHTLNVHDAKQHLQKAEMLVMPVPGQQLLKCEVLSALAEAHKLLGEAEFQRRCYNKGLELSKDTTASNSDRRCLAEWAIYYHLHLAESLVASGQAEEAAQQVTAAASLAGSQNLVQQQVLCNLVLMQLSVMQWDKQEAAALAASVADGLKQLEEQQDQQQGQQGHAPSAGPAANPQQGQQQQQEAASSHVAYLRLHFSMLQVMLDVQKGDFKQLYPTTAGQDQPAPVPPIVDAMDDLLQELSAGQQQHQQALPSVVAGQQQQHAWYHWLPLPAMSAAVQLLAAMIDKPAGKQKQGQARISRGLQMLDSHIAALHQDKAATSEALHHPRSQQELRVCLSLRVLLLETRQQLHLLCSDYAAARADAVDSMRVLSQFPRLLSGLKPVVHLQAGLYAQAVGAYAAAASHFMAAADGAQEQGLTHLAADGRSLAAVCCVAQDTEESVRSARELLGPEATDADPGLGYASRSLRHIAGGLLQLTGPNVSSVERGDAKQQFSKALKIAHSRMHNHQVVSQLLMLMAPLQVDSADVSGAKSMLSSCVQLSHGAGDLHTQVAALKMGQQLLEATKNQEGAQNRNYVARKEEELSGRIQAAESDAQQHHLVLTWGLN